MPLRLRVCGCRETTSTGVGGRSKAGEVGPRDSGEDRPGDGGPGDGGPVDKSPSVVVGVELCATDPGEVGDMGARVGDVGDDGCETGQGGSIVGHSGKVVAGAGPGA